MKPGLEVQDGIRAIWIDRDKGPIVILSYDVNDEYLTKLKKEVKNG